MKWNNHPLFKKHPFSLSIASVLGIGFLPAGGTWGSLAGILVLPLLVPFPLLTICVVILSFLAGIWTIPNLIKGKSDKDPGYVVIDEFMGQLVVFALLPYTFINPLTCFLGFLLFRLFDILKPWPVSFFDRKMNNAWGIMLDDLMAGVYASSILALMQILSLY